MSENLLAGRIAQLRKEAGMTQEQLGNALGLTYQSVSKWENGLSCPDVQLLPQLAERCRRALEQGGMLPVTTAALRSRIVRETEHGVSICTELTGPWPYRCRGDVWADGLPVGLGECFPPHALWRRCLRETAQERGLVLHPGDFWLGEEGLLLPGSRPSGGYEVVCLPYDPELGPLDPLGP